MQSPAALVSCSCRRVRAASSSSSSSKTMLSSSLTSSSSVKCPNHHSKPRLTPTASTASDSHLNIIHQSTLKSLSTTTSCSTPNGTLQASAASATVAGVDLVQKSPVILVVVSFYKFADLVDFADFRKPLKHLCQQLRVSGGIILAPEGINGSICGTRESVERVIGFIQADDRLKGLRLIESPVSPEEEAIHHGHTGSSPLAAGEDAPFRWDHVRVKLKKEIVSLGLPSISPNERVGKYVNPRDWNDLISDPETVVIDVRNAYETRIGKFKGAVDPRTKAFREFPSWVEDRLQVAQPESELLKAGVEPTTASTKEWTDVQEQKAPPKVAMYCTGGIRCEKASSYLLSKGFKEVYHLKGGILKYLEEVPKTDSLWEGECFVFDKRVSVEHGLGQGTFKLCYGCKQPVSDEDMESPGWELGVSCPYCVATKSEEEKDRARARQRQFAVWGVIGGPDKGRKPATPRDDNHTKASQLSKSI